MTSLDPISWQWRYHNQKTAEGSAITPEYLDRVVDEEAKKLQKLGSRALDLATRFVKQDYRADAPAEFLTSSLYPHLQHDRAPARI